MFSLCARKPFSTVYSIASGLVNVCLNSHTRLINTQAYMFTQEILKAFKIVRVINFSKIMN